MQKPVFVLMFLFVFGFNVHLCAEQQDVQEQDAQEQDVQKQESDDYLEMSIEELMEVEISSSATLTQTTRRLTPAAITTITRDQIRRSGARSLYELLDIYVPNLQMIFAREHPRAMGLRGIISHRSNKFSLLVNGRMMNEKTDFGVMSEVDLPMLSDIHHIDVVRGPSSALYGPGALAMVINIITDNAGTFEGDEITIRGGLIEEYATLEYKRGMKLGPDSGIFFYAGVSDYDGASGKDSPTYLGNSGTYWLMDDRTGNWRSYDYNDKVDHWFKNLNQMPYGMPKWKIYTQYNKGNFDIWGRYTQGGQWIDYIDTLTENRELSREGLTYTQATVNASYKHKVTPELSLEYVLSFDRFANENSDYNQAYFWKTLQEDEYYGKILATWTPHDNHTLALGSEWSHEKFGERYKGTAVSFQPWKWHYPPSTGWMPQWDTDQVSLFGEYQWNINDQFTVFLSGRIDWHEFTHTMYSPRGVLVYTPTKKDTFKFMASRSVRTNTAAQMWIDYNYHDVKSKTEDLKALELRYERIHNKNLWCAASAFLYDHDVLGAYPVADTGTVLVGNVESYGIEVEGGYHKDKFKLDLSHSYTKLLDMTAKSGVIFNNISAHPFGYGDDLAQWHNHTTKVRAEYDLSDNLSVNSAIYVYWGSPGGKDWAKYSKAVGLGSYESGYDDPFQPSAFLNLGCEYKFTQNTSLQVNGYNLLGIIDEGLNKRRVGFERGLPGRYRIHPAAVGVTFTHKF